MAGHRRLLFDTHCHIGLRQPGDHAHVFSRAVRHGVGALTIVGIDLASSLTARRIAHELTATALPVSPLGEGKEESRCSPSCRGGGVGSGTVTALSSAFGAPVGRAFWSAGIHPHNADQHTRDFARIAEMCKVHRSGSGSGNDSWDLEGKGGGLLVAVGESGLDFFKSKTTLDEQLENFKKHLALAKDLGLPIIIHSRDADERMLAVLREFAPLRGIMHCFSSDVRAMEVCLRFGLYISFAAKLTYKGRGALELREACRVCPVDRLLIETDAPFLPPSTKPRGTRNEPAFIADVLEQVALLKSSQIPRAALEAQLWRNSCTVFGVEP